MAGLDSRPTVVERPKSHLSSKGFLFTLAIGVFVVVVLPHFAESGFISSGSPLELRVCVRDKDDGSPIEGALVHISNYMVEDGFTTSDGVRQVRPYFRTTGRYRKNSRVLVFCKQEVYGAIRVSATGYIPSEQSLEALLGKAYDSVHSGTNASCEVRLTKTGKS